MYCNHVIYHYGKSEFDGLVLKKSLETHKLNKEIQGSVLYDFYLDMFYTVDSNHCVYACVCESSETQG